MKNYIFTFLVLVLFSGCSVKVYDTSTVNFIVKDAQTLMPIKNVILKGCSPKVLNSDNNGKFSCIGKSEIYGYYTLQHPLYSRYKLICNSLSLMENG